MIRRRFMLIEIWQEVLHNEPQNTPSLRVATVEVLGVGCQTENETCTCELQIRNRTGQLETFTASGKSERVAMANAVSLLCSRPFVIERFEEDALGGANRLRVFIAEQPSESDAKKGNTRDLRAGVGRYVVPEAGEVQYQLGFAVAALRAAHHAGLLKAAYRANNQKVFRGWASEIAEELEEVYELETRPSPRRLEAESAVLEHLNRVASAAVVTATNYPQPTSVLRLYDTSAWLYDSQGRRRDSCTDTDFWLAWYPGVDNEAATVDEIIDSMPKAPPAKIPWIVRLFENPESWIRFRGAVDLEDHDVMHVLLGRGLQDQDEAFVIGFAMGTAKKSSWFQYWVFKFVIGKLYPEPYRIPKFLQPAFDLGVQCGRETGNKDLYKQQLKTLRSLTLQEARAQAGIDMAVVRKYFRREQERIPFTIASLRLP